MASRLSFPPVSDAHDARLRERLASLARRGLRRAAPKVENRRGVTYELDGRPVTGLCSNDYLGLADDPTAEQQPAAPPGAGASRLVCGDLESHRALERRLAQFVGSEDAVLFPSGYQANVGVLPALLSPNDHVHSDSLNHASLIDGLRLSAAPRTIVEHGDSPHLVDPSAGFDWWVTEAIFSMDGDRVSPLAVQRHLARGGCVYLDEAHSFGLFDGGRGLADAHGLRPTVTVYPLGKSAGVGGAFVAASGLTCDWVRTRARSFVFSTGVSPAHVERINRALDRLASPHADTLRQRLWENVAQLGAALGEPEPPSPIFPVLVGDNARTVEVSDALLARGWHVQPIRPPTVPEGTARLRITVSAGHDPADIERFAADLHAVLDAHSIRPRVLRGAQPEPSSASTGAAS